MMKLVRSERLTSDNELDEDCEVHQADELDEDCEVHQADELDKISKVLRVNTLERVRVMNECK